MVSEAYQQPLFADTALLKPWERDDQSDRLFAQVVFNRPVEDVFLYEVPYPMRARIGPGKRVAAPFGSGNTNLVGYCVGLVDESHRRALKRISGVIDEEALLSPVMLELARWVGEHYCCSYGQALDAMLPVSVKAGVGVRRVAVAELLPAARTGDAARLPAKQGRVIELLAGASEPVPLRDLARAAGCTLGPIHALARRGLVGITEREVMPLEAECEPSEAPQQVDPNPDQERALARITERIEQGGYYPVLLHGVTGSGKTEVYLRAIERVVRQGRQAIVLVPEISLTPQTIRRFRGRFPRVAVLHSHLADAERHAQWRRIAAGEAQVVVGARSAIFAPTRRLGLIVIDEEHENTFKQETTPRYHARDVARCRAELEQIPLLLGSATPSLESWHLTQTSRFELVELPERVLRRPLPDVKLIDLRSEHMGRRRHDAISTPLQHAMRRALDDGGQVILLLNRRGFSTHIHCLKCGQVEKCRRCDIALVYHRQRRAALCHFCDLEVPPPRKCSGCGDPGIQYWGLGTEKLEEEVHAKFPGFKLARMDTDSMRGRGSHERVLAAFRSGSVRILLGTQMIAKGLDFPGVTLVGVINADTSLHLPDFRAAERTFQLVAQVSGRTGRGEQAGRVLVQTLSPGHPAIQAAARHDFHAFAAGELPHRRAHGYPPYGRMARIIVRSQVQPSAVSYADHLAAQLRQGCAAAGTPARVLGPAPAPVSRVKNFYRYHLQLQAGEEDRLEQLIRPTLAAHPPPRRVEVAVDVDPLAML